jgi:hypothetical protein
MQNGGRHGLTRMISSLFGLEIHATSPEGELGPRTVSDRRPILRLPLGLSHNGPVDRSAIDWRMAPWANRLIHVGERAVPVLHGNAWGDTGPR